MMRFGLLGCGRIPKRHSELPTALPFVPAYDRFNLHPEQFPSAFRDQGHIQSLPMFAEMTTDQVRTLIESVRQFSRLSQGLG